MNNKLLSTKHLTAMFATMMMISQSTSWAGITAVRNSPTTPSASGGSGSTSTEINVTQGKQVDSKVNVSEGTAKAECSQDPDVATYFPLDFFQNISRDGSSITFEKSAEGKVIVNFPASIKSCGKFKPQLHQDPVTRNVTIFVQLENGKKTYKDYLDCLKTTNVGPAGKEQPILSADGKIEMDNIPSKEFSGYSYEMSYDTDGKRDAKKSVKLSYGSPKNFEGKDGYKVVNGVDETVQLPLCMRAEKVAAGTPGITYLHEGRDVLINRLKAICETGKAQDIADAKKTIGNAEALQDIAEKIKAELDAGYLAALKGGEVKDIYARMSKIEDQLAKELNTIDETAAKKLVKEYGELAQSLSKNFLNKGITRVEDLMIQSAEMKDDDPKKKAINDEIKKLNLDIAAFSKRPNTGFGSLYTVMEKYAITDSAKDIEDIRLKSQWYGKVYNGPADDRGQPLSIEDANKREAAGLQKFEKVLVDWSDVYLVGKGNMLPFVKTSKARAGVVDSMNKRWNNYQQDEQKKYQQYCASGFTGAPKNPVQCQVFISGADKRRKSELSKRDKDLASVAGYDNKFKKMDASYMGYEKKRQATAEAGESTEFDPYGAPIASGDDFRDLFPQFYGNLPSTNYDPSVYNMGVPSAASMGNNIGMNNPMMVNPQAQVQQGQFQMQTRAGGWPTL